MSRIVYVTPAQKKPPVTKGWASQMYVAGILNANWTTTRISADLV